MFLPSAFTIPSFRNAYLCILCQSLLELKLGQFSCEQAVRYSSLNVGSPAVGAERKLYQKVIDVALQPPATPVSRNLGFYLIQ